MDVNLIPQIICVAYNSDTECNEFQQKYRKFNNSVIIIEEAHNFINGVFNKTTVPKYFYNKIHSSTQCKFILLSGTPII